jgi:hypothetical protein
VRRRSPSGDYVGALSRLRRGGPVEVAEAFLEGVAPRRDQLLVPGPFTGAPAAARKPRRRTHLADESQLSATALVFGNLRAREVMQPRPEIDYVTTADTIDQVLETAMRTGRTRLPLVAHDRDLESRPRRHQRQ